ncbi:ribose ABC transporter substrate-binding protein RbsB [Acrocarpospora macrocephala]|uniref:D-ribose ABC transporter substrate-binding protein n=1 Tax=Acrocarpospora macrocephala TaxID=150177 RepID=A0A5M3WTF5_9ACTN|nr:substrate-binding domain-containing protein [Acrocarpospora macrocephala]GES12707.1 D-ribose ABC transporter substrate-binding protein [Acrocarpospora macrocephala]
MITRKLSGLLLAGALALIVTGCSSGTDPAAPAASASGDGKYTIGVANFMLGGPYFSGMDKAIAAQAKKKGNVEIISTDANGDAAKLASNVEDLLSKNVDAVIISGGPLESAPAVLNSIKAAGKPVVLVDRKFQTGEYTSWIGPDNEAIGRQNGEFLAEKLPDGGKVGIIKGGPADNTIGSARTNGVKSVLSAKSNITLVEAPDFGNWGSDGGLTVMESLLATNGDLKAVFCENDAMCLGAQRAIADAGKTDQIIIAGVDGQAEALKAIMDGTNYLVTGLNDADIIGAMGLDRAVEILGGAQVEKDTVVPSPRVTKENAKQFMNPDGSF